MKKGISTDFFWFCVVVMSLTLLVETFDTDEELYSMNELLLLKKRMKHIFIWTKPQTEPIVFLGKGQKSFLQKNCAETNCYVTSDKSQNISHFDMVVFHAPDFLRKRKIIKLPSTRSPRQIYVFATKECPANYLICNHTFDNYFNWTWTHRLDSDLMFGYILIKDKQGNVIGPKENINWMKVEDMEPIDEALRYKLKRKRKAAAWFVSNCKARSQRLSIAVQIQYELEKHGLTLDIYGKCGRIICKKDPKDVCAEVIDKYYFYLAFENSFGEDYVSEKLLRALNHYAVPVVYGGANYSRFMPDGIYLNIRKLGVIDTVNTMVYLINNKEEYYKYFRWHNHYSYHDPEEFPETDPYCNLCAALNDEERLIRVTNHTNFDEWWNEGNNCTHRTK